MSQPKEELEKFSQAETVFHSAIDLWWRAKEKNGKKNAKEKNEIKKSQGGSRDANLAGDTMDGFRDTLIEILVTKAGVDRADIFTGGQFSQCPSNLPSYFRATKNWDVVVCKRALVRQLERGTYDGSEKLVAAIEFKSQYQSIGNNQNNRIEESIGNAEDFWASYENKNFLRLIPRPWLGYLFVGYYAEGDETKPVEIKQPIMPTDPAFIVRRENDQLMVRVTGHSYAERYRIFLERMIAKKRYDGACFLVSHEDIRSEDVNYRVLFPSLSGAAFIDGLVRHVRAYYPD